MEVIVGSQNEPKKLAVCKAFEAVYPEEEVVVRAVDVDSGVSSHPVTAEESLEGAANRVKNAKSKQPDADFYVGIEGGLLRVGDRAWEHSWVVVEDRSGQAHTSISAGLQLRGKLLEAILSGQELSEAFAEQFGVQEAGKKKGLYGFATNNIVTRESATVEAVVFALAAFSHPEYFQ
jgi:inosine/xanthosine triphosphatase